MILIQFSSFREAEAFKIKTVDQSSLSTEISLAKSAFIVFCHYSLAIQLLGGKFVMGGAIAYFFILAAFAGGAIGLYYGLRLVKLI